MLLFFCVLRGKFHLSNEVVANVNLLYSLSLKSGVDVRTLSETLGHFSAGFTLSTFVHSMPGMKQSAADAIANTIRNAI